MYLCIYLIVCVHTHTHTYTHAYTHIYMHAHTHTHTHTHTYIHTYMSTCIHTHTHTHRHTHTYSHTHTHTPCACVSKYEDDRRRTKKKGDKNIRNIAYYGWICCVLGVIIMCVLLSVVGHAALNERYVEWM